MTNISSLLPPDSTTLWLMFNAKQIYPFTFVKEELIYFQIKSSPKTTLFKTF